MGDDHSAGLPLPRPLWHLALRQRQATPRRTQAARASEPFLRGSDRRAPPDRHPRMRNDARRGRQATQPEIARLQRAAVRSEEHTSELKSLMRISYAVFRLKQQIKTNNRQNNLIQFVKEKIYTL